MTDKFLEEVEEGLRSDRYRSLAGKALPWVIAFVAALILGVGGMWAYGAWREKAMATAANAYQEGLKASAQGPSPAAATAFDKAAKAGAPAYKALALMQQAKVQLADNKTAEAVKLFDAAAKATGDPVLKDAAGLKAALALLDTAPLADVEARLKPLAAEGRPFRPAALEALAMARLKAGNTQAAREDFAILRIMPSVPDTIRQRADAAISLIDGGAAKMLPQAVKAAESAPQLTLPTMPPAGAMPQAQPAPGAAQ